VLDAISIQLAGTVFLGLVGLWLAHNYRRQIRLKLADRQVDAYMRLWKLTSVATPSRATPLDQVERQKLHDEIHQWYHGDGNGLFVSVETRDLLLSYQSNLVCPISKIKPAELAEQLSAMPEVDAERRRGCISKRHATLLRYQLKNDLVLHISFVSYYNDLRSDDRAFLKSCGLSPWRRPWRPRRLRPRDTVGPIPCVCGLCGP
jgi:hypothetical protein